MTDVIAIQRNTISQALWKLYQTKVLVFSFKLSISTLAHLRTKMSEL